MLLQGTSSTSSEQVKLRFKEIDGKLNDRLCKKHGYRTPHEAVELSYDKHGFIVSLQSSQGAQLSYERNAYGELVCFRAGEAETSLKNMDGVPTLLMN